MVQVNTCARLLLLACASLPALAARGSTKTNAYIPTVCNNAPTQAPGQGQARRSVQSLDAVVPLDLASTVGTAYIPVTTAHGPGKLADFTPLEVRSPSSFTIRGGSRSEPDRDLKTPLAKRGGKITFDESCNANLPSGSNNYKGLFPGKTILMSDIAQYAYNQAVQLASTATLVDADSNAYKHYFGTTDSLTLHTIWNKMMNLIASPAENFNVQFACNINAKECTTADGSPAVAFTDATVANPAMQQKTINLCKPFFTSASTRFVLYDEANNENSPPFRSATSSGWCNTKSPANFFATMGHSILHELTHLDTLAQQAGLEPADDGTHGTVDVVSNPKDKTLCQLFGARDYLINGWGKDNDLPDPSYNAESHAGAATEAFFMNICPNNELTDIPPK